jgi:CBS domain containing-hemolysin-like protein
VQAAEHLSFSAYAWRLGLVVLLVLANAFFVAAEFALVGARRSKIDQLVSEGDRLAKVAQSAIKDLDRYISATQLGITLASLGLGWIGEPALAGLVDQFLGLFGVRPPAAAVHTAAGAITAFIVITFLHIVLGELAPKSIALVKAEGVSRVLAIPLMLFAKVMSPAISVLNGTANWMMRKIGIAPQSEAHHIHSPEELRLLVMQARAHGTLDETDSAMLAGVFDFHEKKAYDVMRPRTEVAALDIDSTEEDVWAVVRRERYSRYPVYRDTLDDVLGVFLAKDLWLHDGQQPFTLNDFVRPALYVPSSKPAERVMDDLRKTRAQMAVVLDEYGGTAGILTMEDLVEEVVGDIADEYDFASRTAVIMDGVLELAGSMSLVDVRSDYGLRIPEGDWTTLGGYAFGRLGRLPKIGDRVGFPGGELEIIALEGRRVAGLRVHRDNADKVAATTPAGAAAH